MSSHHIVKEKQEPALYIYKLGDFDEELLGQLLEWAPTIIVQEEEYEKISSLGIKVDLISCQRAMETSEEHVSFIISEDGLSGVLDFLIKKEYPAVNILGADTDFHPAYAEEINIVWFNNNLKSFSIRDGFTVWKPAGSIFIFDDPDAIEMINLKQLPGRKYAVISDGFITLNFEDKVQFISEEL